MNSRFLLSLFPATLAAFGSLAASAVAYGNTGDVVAAEKARRAALLAGDAKALANLLSDDLRYCHSTGRLEDKASVVGGIASKAVRYERFEVDHLEAREITAEVAVLTGTIDQRKVSHGKAGDAKLLFHGIWHREAGTWRLVSIQTVQTPAPQP